MQEARQLSEQYSRIHQIIEPWVSQLPDGVALQDKQRRLTYREVDASIRHVSGRLIALGIRPGDRVLVVAENCVAAGVLVMALSAVDAWAVVVNARLSAREIETFLDHSGARRAFYTHTVGKDAGEHAARHGAVAESWPGIGEVAIGPLNEGAVAEPAWDDPRKQTAVMIYTSGTSGQPKAVMLSHANMLHIAQVIRTVRRLGPQDKIYGVLPMAHIMGLSGNLVAALACGSTLLLEDLFSPQALANAILEERLTILLGVPVMFAKLLDWCRSTGTDISKHSLRIIGVAGSPLTPKLKEDVERAFGMVLQNNYGLSEMAPTVTQTVLSEPRRDCSVGKPVPGVELRIVDEHGKDVVPGEVGALWVRGPNLMLGYYRNEAMTREAINAEGWFNTADLGRQEPDGGVFIMGRKKELIIRSGFNVYPTEVEQALNSHASVVQSAVVGREVEGNEEVIAFVEMAPGATVTADELKIHLRARLSPYKIPAEIHFMAQLPAAPTGKILKNALKDLAMKSAEAPRG
ncbi:class I adenylate-forming enzyme family protein [Paraburkholderia pallida]|uniref:Long-chain fatty acid--CoA ligase n=1 Tax=Paraburkholderia pallida TaxID=2547399 RepID=A0A4P7CP35_9BURK|nr:AMP-binding protein [Paraburkholderia pallida]QBQ97585.1 long-chain fatty acid--CoA ligase [Paraburkholderia pallida]